MKANKKKIREMFREECLKRDKFKCCFCDIKDNLDVHHITDRHLFENGGYVKSNGISLCSKHHLEAEQYHISNGVNFVQGMHPNDLYKRINSSFEKAKVDDLKNS